MDNMMILDLSFNHPQICGACKFFSGERRVNITSRGAKIVTVKSAEAYCSKKREYVHHSSGFGCWDYQEV